MGTNVLLLAPLDGIKPEGDYDASDQIDQFHCFINDPGVVVPQLLGDKITNFRKSVGEIDFNSILKSNAAVYFQTRFDNDEILEKVFKELSLNAFIDAFHFRLLAFVQFLWLIKDSSASIGGIYCIMPNFLNVWKSMNCFWSCEGEIGPVAFQREDIKSAIRFLESYRTSQNERKLSTPAELERTGGFPSEFSTGKSRFEKALLMLQVVRESQDLALKIAHYCSCFEILFSSSTDNEGISYQLAERMAFFLSASVKERVTVYEDVREAYRVRCAIFHGKFLGPKRQEQLKRICVSCDALLRKTLCRILTSSEFADLFTEKDEQFDQHFRDLILGAYAVETKSL